MRRRLLNFVTVLSLLFSAAIVVLWVRSYWRSDYVNYVKLTPGDQVVRVLEVSFETGRGTAGVAITRQGFWVGPELSAQHLIEGSSVATLPAGDPLESCPKWGGFGCQIFGDAATNLDPTLVFRYLSFAFPLWLPTTLFAVLPLARAYSRFRRKYPPRHCERCGYDLRATLGRCPECGALSPAPSVP